MIPLLRLIRLPNLIIVALTQALLYYRVILPALSSQGIAPVMSSSIFWLLCGITVNIAAAGYLINDLHDREADALNRPERQVLGKHVSEQIAYWLYMSLSISGFLAALLIAFVLGKLKLLFIYPLAYAALYWYSAEAQRRVLIGNMLIALFCAGVAAIVWLAEAPSLYMLRASAPEAYARAGSLMLWYAIFAFLINLYREVVKDIEDVDGDARTGLRTLPILYGVKTAKSWGMAASGLLLLFLAAGALLLHRHFGPVLPLFLATTVGLPLIWSMLLLQRAAAPAQYRRISHLIKWMILAGVGSLGMG